MIGKDHKVSLNVWKCEWICLPVCKFFSICQLSLLLLNSVFLLISLSDPLEMKTSASAEWSSSHKGTSTPVIPACPCTQGRLCAFVSPRQWMWSRKQASSVLQISLHIMRLAAFTRRAAAGAREQVTEKETRRDMNMSAQR